MRLLLGPLAIALALAGCKTVGPDYHVPAEAAINRPEAQKPFLDEHSTATDNHAPVIGRWWKLYDDPVLDTLVEQALYSNANLRAASANLQRAYASYDEVRAQGDVSATASASAERALISAESYLQTEKLPTFNLASAGLSASYELDLFGKLKRATEAAGASTEATVAAMDLARITVAAQVARSYLESCHANHELSIAQHSLDLQQRNAEVTQQLLNAGRGNRIDLSRAKAQVDILRASLPPIEARKKAAQYMLANLLGRTPGDIPAAVDQCHDAPELKQPIPIGDGMTLLKRRPDVREAERKLAVATARIGIATAELYPSVTLGAGVGENGTLNDFAKAPTRYWSIGPLITWTLPSRGAHARIRATEAGADAALAQFDQTVLNALQETQTALSNYARALDRQASLHQALDEASHAAEQNRRLYQAGRSPYLSSLDAERTRASTAAAAADADSAVSQAQVALFLALGGGWQGADAGR